jgi:hypothetical protein
MATAIYAEILAHLEHMTRLNAKILVYLYEARGSNGGKDSGYGLVVCDAIEFGIQGPSFRRTCMFLKDVYIHLPDYTTSHSGRPDWTYCLCWLFSTEWACVWSSPLNVMTSIWCVWFIQYNFGNVTYMGPGYVPPDYRKRRITGKVGTNLLSCTAQHRSL